MDDQVAFTAEIPPLKGQTITSPANPQHATIMANNPSPKTHEVMSNPYLVGMILPRVDMKTLLLATRVCKDWKAIIDTSSKIQKKLFFKPDRRKRILRCHECRRSQSDPYDDPSSAFDCLASLMMGISCIRPPFVCVNSLVTHELYDTDRRISLDRRPLIVPQLKPPYQHHESWRRMYLTQPPVTAVSVTVGYSDWNGGDYIFDRVSVKHDVGVTWSQMMDVLAACTTRVPFTSWGEVRSLHHARSEPDVPWCPLPLDR